MLTSENIATLRRAAYRSQNRRVDGPWDVVRFEGGPLDGIRLSVTERESVSWRLGFCTLTDAEPLRRDVAEQCERSEDSRRLH